MNSNNKQQELNERILERFSLKADGNGSKPFYKSIRFGYEIFEALDSVMDVTEIKKDGKSSFNEAFENICIDYIRTIPEREAKVKELDRKIKEKQKQLEKLDKALRDVQWLSDGVESLQNQLKRVNSVAESLINNHTSKNP